MRKLPSHGVLWKRLLLLSTKVDLRLRDHLTQHDLVKLIEEEKKGIALVIQIQEFDPKAKSWHYHDEFGLLDVDRLQRELSRLRSVAQVERLAIAAAKRWEKGLLTA